MNIGIHGQWHCVRGIRNDASPFLKILLGPRASTEVNARLNPDENAYIMGFYGPNLRILQISSLFLAALCGLIAYATTWSDEVLALLSLPLIIGYAIGDEVLWLRLEKFARGRGQ